MKRKVTIIADAPTPHQNVLFDALADSGKLDLEVVFCRRQIEGCSWIGAPPTRARWRFEPEIHVGGTTLNPGLPISVAREADRICVLVGYYLPGMLAAAVVLGGLRRPWVFSTDTLPPRDHDSGLPRWQQRIGAVACDWCLQRSTALLTTGEAGAASLRQHGVQEERIFSIPFVVDHDRIQRAMREQRARRAETRASLRVNADERLLVFVGRLLKLKGLDVLLRAMATAKRAGNIRALIIGDGEENDRLRSLTSELGLQERVTYLPAMNNEDLPKFWAAADAFVLPSRQDAWPVVVVEALVAGLPVLGSEAAGSVRDRVEHGSNGWVFPKGDVDKLSSLLEDVSSLDGASLERMGQAAEASMRRWAPSAMAHEFERVIEEVARRHALGRASARAQAHEG